MLSGNNSSLISSHTICMPFSHQNLQYDNKCKWWETISPLLILGGSDPNGCYWDIAVWYRASLPDLASSELGLNVCLPCLVTHTLMWRSQRQANFWVLCQPGLQIETLSQKKQKIKKNKTKAKKQKPNQVNQQRNRKKRNAVWACQPTYN